MRAPAERGGLSALIAELASAPEADLADAWARAPRPGERVGRFELVRELGRGGFGVVLEARDVELGRRVAFKAVRPGRRARDPAREALLAREAAAVAALHHPNIVTLHDVGRSEAGPYLVLELLEGETLADRLVRGPLPAREAVQVARAVGRALEHAHARGVLHRDLKPGNVFLTAGGEVKVLDFGLAHVFGRDGVKGGTPGYMAPEQRAGGAEDARTDLFALGVLLGDALGDGAGAPTALRALAANARDPDPARRPASAAAFLAALEDAGRKLRPGRRRLRLALAAGGVLAVAAAVVGYLAGRAAPDAASRGGLGAPRPAEQSSSGPHPGSVRAGAADAEAHRWYVLGTECATRPTLGEDCGALFRNALARDPAFAAAWYRLAAWSASEGGDRAEQRFAIEKALEHARGAPDKERLLAQAWKARIDRRPEEALARYREATRRWPDDPEAFFEAGATLRAADDLAAALPWLERAAALDPGSPRAQGLLAEALGATGRADDLRARIAAWEGRGDAAAWHAVSIGRGWLGELPAAEGAARSGVDAGGGLVAREDLVAALVLAGRYADAEAALAALASAGTLGRPLAAYALATLDAYRGDPRAGDARLAALVKERPALSRDALHLALRVDHALGLGRAEARARAEELLAVSPADAPEHAAGLAWVGEAALAARLAAGLAPGSVEARAYAGVAAVRAGDVDRGLEALRALAAEHPVTAWRLPPRFLYADLAAEHGRGAEAARALRAFQALYLPRTMWRGWAYPRSVAALARLGASAVPATGPAGRGAP
ncbi:MAG: protein kinase [Anaeromyxobacteraceae bacterium]